MPTVQTTITISIPDEGMSLQELENAVAQAARRACQQLLTAAAQEMETRILQKAGSTLHPDKQRPLDLLTRFGWVKLHRRQVQEATTGHYTRPLDAVLGLQPRQHASPWVVGLAVQLATRIPYRQATQLLTDLLEDQVDHRTVWRWVQEAGAQVVAEEDAQQEAVFGQGEEAACDPREREIVVSQVDGTFLKAQREGVPEFEVRLGVLYSGKELVSLTAKQQRYRLTERVRYGGVEEADAFGERLFLHGEARLGLSRAQHLLLVGDGAEWIEALAGHERWKATYQLDWWHLMRAFHRTFPDRPSLVAALKEALYEGRGAEVVGLVALAKVQGMGDAEKVRKLEGYVRANQHGLYGARWLRGELSPQAKLVAVEGAGAVEKQMDVVVGRRFKGQGMRWTRRGANRLLKLRLRELERAA